MSLGAQRGHVLKLVARQAVVLNACGIAAGLAGAGIPSLVFGPGDIAQAHTRDEWVATGELARVASTYQRLLTHPR